MINDSIHSSKEDVEPYSFQLYESHIPTSAMQKLLLTAGSALMALYNPTRAGEGSLYCFGKLILCLCFYSTSVKIILCYCIQEGLFCLITCLYQEMGGINKVPSMSYVRDLCSFPSKSHQLVQL